MSRHLPDCAGDDYCTGECRHDGIPQPAILERASDISCNCDWRLLFHDRYCLDTPIWADICAYVDFNPNILSWSPQEIDLP